LNNELLTKVKKRTLWRGKDLVSEASLTCRIEVLACQALPTPGLVRVDFCTNHWVQKIIKCRVWRRQFFTSEANRY